MRIIFIYNFFPVFIFPTNKLGNFSGETYVLPGIIFITILKNDYIKWESQPTKMLVAHELVHAKQGLLTLFTHPLWYWLSMKYRFWAECSAYQQQLNTVGLSAVPWVLDSLTTNYKLTYTRDDMKNKLLIKYFKGK